MSFLANASILLPLGLIVLGSVVAALFGLPALNSRLSITRLSWLLAFFPLAAFGLLALMVPGLNDGEVYSWRVEWIPSLGVSLGLYIDSLAALFGLIITLIGVLVIVYGGYYFKGDPSAWRFQAYMLLFMASMLGLVLAGDVLTLFIFWEGTSMVSFLLIAYKTKEAAARQGAFRALFITGGGGIALLAGLLVVSFVAGTTDLATILTSGEVLRNSPLYLVMLGLVSFGAFTKSAQFPAHIWLPGAMSAPTPASAYLHSATMVKAGIYLMARMNPALGGTESWFWLLTLAGLTTMLAGAYLGLKQNDLKALLAYSTVSQLGVLMMLIGLNIDEAYKALIIGIVAHALYKSALFLVAGIVDHETGSRDIRHLGGLRRVMPYTFVVATVAALSMAGLPPLFGFLAKETLLAAAIHPTLPPVIGALLPWASVLAGALILAQAGLLIRETFLGQPKDPDIHGHEAPTAMWLMPALPAVISIVFSLLPGVGEEAVFLAGAASDAFGEDVKVSLALWHGINVPLLLSIVAVTLGSIIFYFRAPIRARMESLLPNLSFNALYDGVLAGIDRSAVFSTRLQSGSLRVYLTIIIASMSALVIIFANRSLIPDLSLVSTPQMRLTGADGLLRVIGLLVTVGAAVFTVWLRRDFAAVMAMMAAGLGIAILFILEPAPDVALVQIVVDLLATVILVIALTRIPREQRESAQAMVDNELRGRDNQASMLRDLVVAVVAGAIVASISFVALSSRPRQSVVTPYYESNAKVETGATDVVGAIIVDYRQLDTLIEISVFAVAGLAAFMLLRYATRKYGDTGKPVEGHPDPIGMRFSTFGIGGRQTSAFIRVGAATVFPVALILAVVQMMYGHDQPGDGFTAGVIISLAVGLWYFVYGYNETRRRLPWLRGAPLISGGILLAIGTGMISALLTGNVLGNVNYGEMAGLSLPSGFYISSSFLFEIAICLAVLGSVALLLDAFGNPGDDPAEGLQKG
jgi:NADH:ubiquinone oxidoreductase subunit 5 (subunit L)/multisubunit Na+/H+ antiporter MnhA subunit